MPISEARKRANQKWNKKNMTEKYYRPVALIPKEKQEAIEQRAAEQGYKSISKYINDLIEADMQKDQG